MDMRGLVILYSKVFLQITAVFLVALFAYGDAGVFETKRAHAAVADIGIWQDSAGAQIPGTAFAAFNFATESRNDGTYTFAGGNNLNLNDAGNYLVIANIKLNDTSNGRVNYEGRFTYTGTGSFVTLYGTGYSRNNGNNTSWVRVVGLVWGAGANDDIQLEMRRDTDTPTGGSVANASYVQVVRLQDTAAVGLYSDAADTGTYGTQVWTDAPFDNIILENDTAVIQRQAGNTDIRLKKDATTFLVGYGMAFDTSDGQRTQRVSKMVAGVADIPSSFSYAYQRNTANELASPNGLFLYRNSGTATDLSVQAQRGNAVTAGGPLRRVSTSGMFVVELPSYIETFISYDSTGGQDVSGAASLGDYNAMETVSYNDAASFTKVDNFTMNVEGNMDMLLMGQAYIERTGTSATRATIGTRFEIAGVDQAVGEYGNYLRGNQGTPDTYNMAFSPSGIYAATLGDDVQMEFFDAGDNGSTDFTVASAVGFGALNLDSIIPPPDLTQTHYRWRNLQNENVVLSVETVTGQTGTGQTLDISLTGGTTLNKMFHICSFSYDVGDTQHGATYRGTELISTSTLRMNGGEVVNNDLTYRCTIFNFDAASSLIVNRYSQTTTGTSITNVPITPVSAMSQTFVVPHGEAVTGDVTLGQEEIFQYKLTSTTNVEISQDDPTDEPNSIYFEVVDWSNSDIRVQHVNANLMLDTELTDTATIPQPIVLGKTWMIANGRTEGGAWSEYTGAMNFRADFLNNTTVRARRGSLGRVGGLPTESPVPDATGLEWSVQVIEDVSSNGIWDVQQGNISMTGAQNTGTLTLSPGVDTNRTFVFGTSYTNFSFSGESPDETTDNQDTASAEVALTNATTITATRGVNDGNAFDLVVQSVDLGPYGGDFPANEDIKLVGLPKLQPKRLRLQISNEGLGSSPAVNYRLEVSGPNPAGGCAAAAYTRVDSSPDWTMVNDIFLTDGQATVNGVPGLTDENATFVAGELKDLNDQTTGTIALSNTEFTELEFSLQATAASTFGADYCFRLTASGDASDFTYTNYAEVSIESSLITLDQKHYRWINDDGVYKGSNVIASVNTYTGNTGTGADLVIPITDGTATNKMFHFCSFSYDTGDGLHSSTYRATKITATSTLTIFGGSATNEALDYNCTVVSYDTGSDLVVSRYQPDMTQIGAPNEVLNQGITLVSAVSQAFIIPHGEENISDTDIGQEELWDLQLTSTSNVQVSVDGGAEETNYIYFEVVDWGNSDIRVQHLNGNAMTTVQTTDTAIIPIAVTPAKTWLITTGRTEGAANVEQTGAMNLRADFQDTTTVRVRRGITNSVGMNWSAQVIEDVSGTGLWDVQSGNISMAAGALTGTLTLSPPVNSSKTFVSGTAFTNFSFSGESPDASTSNNDTASAMVALTSSTTITATRGVNDGNIFDMFVQSVDFGTSGATFAANQDIKLNDLAKLTTKRLRFEVSNEGTNTSSSIPYRLEVSNTNPTSCASATYTRVDSSSHWNMISTTYFADGDATTNIVPGLTDENTTFVASQMKESNDQVAGVALTNTQFTEIEFAVQPTSSSVNSASYCFRLTNAGSTTDFTYTQYAEVSIEPVFVGVLSVDIVDSMGSVVASPVMNMFASVFEFPFQTTTGIFGTTTEKIRITNTTAVPGWTLSVAASSTTAIWNGVSTNYDFNDPTANAGDGGDADSLGGQLTIDPATSGVITPQGGCSSTGISLGSSAAFSEGVTDQITIAVASGGADVSCFWDLTNIDISQTLPPEQGSDTYTIDMVLTII